MKFQKKIKSIFQNWFFGLFKPNKFQKNFWEIYSRQSTPNFFLSLYNKNSLF